MATSSSSGRDASRVRVQPERRQQVDLAKLAAALIELASSQLEAEGRPTVTNKNKNKHKNDDTTNESKSVDGSPSKPDSGRAA